MRKKEQRLWDCFKRNKPANTWLQRVENVVSEGMPDVYAAFSDAEPCWVELKAVTCPAKQSSKLLASSGLRATQIAWHDRAARMNIKSFVLIRDSNNAIYLVPGAEALLMNDWSWSVFVEHYACNKWEDAYQRIAK